MKKFLVMLGVVTTMAWQSSVSYAQGTNIKELPKGWHLLDKQKDGVFGISMDKAYEFVKGKKSNTVIVAVIDSGIDTLHEDLKEVLWTNPKEIPGNNIDDDKNGYIDDVHGWNFIGGKDGSNVKEDSYEGARVYHRFRAKYENKSVDTASLSPQEKDEYIMWLKAKSKIKDDSGDEMDALPNLQRLLEASLKGDSILRKALAQDKYTGNDLEKFNPAGADEQKAKAMVLGILKTSNMMETSNKEFLESLQDYISGEQRKKESVNKAPRDYRAEIVKDNESDINDRFYGNNDIMASTPFHGTHVSGIIGAKRNNGKGINGIADNVRIMTIRAVPDGDEHDKDVALAIRYAVDNGAKVVNMSFGKSYSPEKHWVDDAVRYADSNGVLLVHAAGNDANDLDTADNYPNAMIRALNNTKAPNWITVGASSDPLAESMVKSYTASFSNYGKEQVDVFAPGTKIYSTIPGGNTYGNAQGTSMASPVVAGVAAFILSYFPDLTPQQVKYAIEKSAVPLTDKVKRPGSSELVSMADISTSGGILNAYEAVKLASTLKPENNKGQKLPKSTLKKNKKG